METIRIGQIRELNGRTYAKITAKCVNDLPIELYVESKMLKTPKRVYRLFNGWAMDNCVDLPFTEERLSEAIESFLAA